MNNSEKEQKLEAIDRVITKIDDTRCNFISNEDNKFMIENYGCNLRGYIVELLTSDDRLKDIYSEMLKDYRDLTKELLHGGIKNI